MGEMRKITVSLPAELVEASLHTTGRGITETIREALAAQNHAWACQRLLELRGKVDLRADYRELTGKDDPGVVIADASVLIAWMAGEGGRETEVLAELVAGKRVLVAPVTVTELLSHTRREPVLNDVVSKLAVVELSHAYWERAGHMRARLRRAGRKAALGDALVAQACIDADLPLLARDRDFRAFAGHAGLKLA